MDWVAVALNPIVAVRESMAEAAAPAYMVEEPHTRCLACEVATHEVRFMFTFRISGKKKAKGKNNKNEMSTVKTNSLIEKEWRCVWYILCSTVLL